MRKFIVCTRGCTASKWLARSLERLPGFECSHGSGSLTHYDKAYQHGELIETIHREWFERQTTPVEEYIDEQIRDRSKRFTGNVHRYQLARHDALFRVAKDVKVGNVIRHPVTWQDSRTALFMDLMQFVPHISQQLHYTVITNFDFLWPFVQRHGLTLVDPEFMCFVGNIVALPELAKDALIKDFPSFKMEDIVQKPEVFSNLVDHISAGEYPLRDEDIEVIFGAQQIHQHRSGSGQSADATFNKWPVWKKELFVPMFFESGLYDAYARFNYDTHFLENAQSYRRQPQELKPNEPGGPFWINTNE